MDRTLPILHASGIYRNSWGMSPGKMDIGIMEDGFGVINSVPMKEQLLDYSLYIYMYITIYI